jgi:hypothetical protein
MPTFAHITTYVHLCPCKNTFIHWYYYENVLAGHWHTCISLEYSYLLQKIKILNSPFSKRILEYTGDRGQKRGLFIKKFTSIDL